jgi:ABC-type molybdate transport system substrate-binding protein
VFAAADLPFSLEEIATQFEKGHDAKVTLVLGSTGQLSQQVAQGRLRTSSSPSTKASWTT